MSSSRPACRRTLNLITFASHSQPGPRDILLSSCTHHSAYTACLLSMDACYQSSLPQSHHCGAPIQLTIKFVHCQLTHPQCALSQPQTHHTTCTHVFHASSKPIQVLLHPSSLESTCLAHAVGFPLPAPVPSSAPLQHPRSSQTSITCPPSSTSLPSLHRAEQHSRQPPFPVSIIFLLVLVCVHTPTSPHTPYATQYDCIQCVQHARPIAHAQICSLGLDESCNHRSSA